MSNTEKAMTFDAKIKEAMSENADEALTGGLWQGKAYKHIYKDMKYNFIDEKYPENSNLKGTLSIDKIKYHRGASHMNSSQALCINYFKKFFEKPCWEKVFVNILRDARLEIPSDEITDAIFEYVPDSEEMTSFDFYLVMGDGSHISFEIKYTEGEFGIPSSKNPGAYHAKWENIYCEMVQCSNYLDCDEAGFYDEFQINRNICYTGDIDTVVFLTPKANNSKGILKGRKYIDYLNGQFPNITNLYWEDIMDCTMKRVSDDEELLDYYSKFKKKYIEIL